MGTAGALALSLSHAWGRQVNAYALVWGLFFLVLEVIVMAILGIMVAGAVLSVRFLVTESATRKTRAVATGVAALMSSSALAFALFSVFPFSENPWAVGGITGVVVGITFATVSYRHTSQRTAPGSC
ncbi:hypothetical protein ACSVHC_15560 [Arthrobacter sp. KNU-44]|uniref:hypothetical protein n=1 Tax=Arthrobacter sp. KNU-44 TaxID=3450744 RepID=UPI003F43E8ED